MMAMIGAKVAPGRVLIHNPCSVGTEKGLERFGFVSWNLTPQSGLSCLTILAWSVVSVRAGVVALLGLLRVGLALQAFSMPGYLL